MKKIINLVHKNYSNKQIAIFIFINAILLIVQPIIKPIKLTKPKQKCSCLIKNKAIK